MLEDNSSKSHMNQNLSKNTKSFLTPYEKFLYDGQYDSQFKEEEKNGDRIRFYQIIKNIGSGGFSRVRLAVHILAKEKVAIKVLDKTKLNSSIQRLLLREVASMERLHHPNIIRLYEVIETAKEVQFVTEYAPGGDLYAYIRDNGKLPERQAKCIFAQITAAVDHMHRKGIIHRDMKSENIILVNNTTVKLIDLGFSTFSEKGQALTTFCGSPPYAAPELYADENYVGIYVDLWAMGVLLYFMVTGFMPFRAENVGKLKRCIIDGNYSIPQHVSPQCQEVIRGLIHDNPIERWSTKTIQTCSWLKNEHFPVEFKELPINIKNFKSSDTEEQILASMSDIEYNAYLKLSEFGIRREHLQTMIKDSDGVNISNRDPINGLYRIILHRLQKQSSHTDPIRSHEEKVSYTRNASLPVGNTIDRPHKKRSSSQSPQSRNRNTAICNIL